MSDGPSPAGEHDAVVVGSGPNGLAAALVLAREGLRVCVLEAEETIGGGARTEPLTIEGYLHDVCSAVHPMAAASPFFRELALDRHGVQWVHADAPLAHPLDDGRAVLLERSVDDTVRGLGRDGPAYRRLIEPLVERFDPLMGEILDTPLHVPRHPWLLARFGRNALRSVRGLAKRFREPGARALLAGLCAHAVLPFHRTSSAAIGIVLGTAGHAVGWPFPLGGAGSISQALAALLRELGGRIRVNAPVRSMDDLPPSRLALFDVAPPRLAQIASHLPSSYRRRLRAFRYGPGAFKIDWALDGPIPWTAEECARAGTVHIGGTLEEIDDALRSPWNGACAERPFVLLAQPSGFDPTRAPAGGHAVWAYCHVPHGSVADMTERIEAQVERFAPGFRDRIVARAARSARQLEGTSPNLVGGDVTGGVPDLGQILARPVLRATPWATPDPRIYLCSASTPPGGGVHGMCGYRAARAALSRARI